MFLTLNPNLWHVELLLLQDSERQARLLLEAEKTKEKAEKKRIKKKVNSAASVWVSW